MRLFVFTLIFTLRLIHMDPSFQFCHWSTKDIGVLIKSKGTIKDIHGDYAFMISGKMSLNCQIAAHCRFPLQALNK
jgi:hypothetical protein